MFILSKNGKKFINFNNVASIEMKDGIYYPDRKWWDVRVIYPAVSSDVLYDTIGDYRSAEECRDAFNKLCCRIVSGKENEVIDMNDL